MSLRDCVLFTLLNTVACLTFPKLVSVVLEVKKTQLTQEEQKIEANRNISTSAVNQEVASVL
ncbi:hypothetical protein WJM97_22210 [Okeanomitos corallinicola TIOX110]|uniref:Uncharacterized protein n=1 Tax=Okeanomitos corallinicola TIOX110 TaxID=3133117 RepID=A0ABZ2USU0_9CYAN